MLLTAVNGLKDVSLEKVNEISMDIARELVKEEFNMDSLAEIETHIMEIAQKRMIELGRNPMENPSWYVGLMIEISLYLGINIGRNNK